MECRITSRSKRRCAGTSYVEVLVAASLGVLLAGALVAFSLFSGRSLLAMSNYMELDAQARTALDNMSKEIRQAQSVTAFSTNSITFKDHDGQPLQFAYDPSRGQLIRTKAGKSTVLLKECETLNFNLLSREPNDGTFDLDSTTDVARGKAIFVSWRCSRKFIDKKVNAANMTTATIVLRLK